MTYQAVIRRALAKLTKRQANGYAGDVLRGAQGWSGADLKGAARSYGGWYKSMRTKSGQAIRAAGGDVIPTEHGYLQAAAPAGMDDYGNELMSTGDALYTAPPAGRVNWLKV